MERATDSRDGNKFFMVAAFVYCFRLCKMYSIFFLFSRQKSNPFAFQIGGQRGRKMTSLHVEESCDLIESLTRHDS